MGHHFRQSRASMPRPVGNGTSAPPLELRRSDLPEPLSENSTCFRNVAAIEDDREAKRLLPLSSIGTRSVTRGILLSRTCSLAELRFGRFVEIVERLTFAELVRLELVRHLRHCSSAAASVDVTASRRSSVFSMFLFVYWRARSLTTYFLSGRPSPARCPRSRARACRPSDRLQLVAPDASTANAPARDGGRLPRDAAVLLELDRPC